MGRGSTAALARALVLAVLLLSVMELLHALGGESACPDSRLGLRTAPLLLLSRADVRADLGLTPSQAASAEQALDELHAKAEALRGKTGPEVLAARRAIDESQQRWLQAQLSEAQRARLAQIDLQWEGPSALVSRPIVADALGLSPDQRARLARAVDQRRRARAQERDRRAAERPLAQETLALLTPDQQAHWKAMLGRPFVPQLSAASRAVTKEQPQR